MKYGRWEWYRDMQREKRTYSGRLMEIDFFPVLGCGKRMPTRAAKSKPSTEEQKRYNRTQAIKKIIRMVNANFDESDYLMHPTYEPRLAPQNEEEARRDIVNYLRRVKTKRASELRRVKKELLLAIDAANKVGENRFLRESVSRLKEKIRKLEKPFKYIYVIEKQTYKTGRYSGKDNWHFHIFLTGGIEDRVLEEMWKDGIRTNCNNYQPEKFSPEAAARYMSKDPQGAKRFIGSRNLTKPVRKDIDGKVSKKTVDRMATERIDDREYWEKKYKGYRFIRCYNRWNSYNEHWYVSVIMYKTEGSLPEWKGLDWITTDNTKGSEG